LDVSAELPSELPEVEADAERLSQILRNLLNNAIQHTPEKGRITVGARVVEKALEITVQDSGVGIEPEHLPYLFERFYRVDRARSRATGGSGLGLAIVKQLVEAHGGHVRVASQPGQGTSFSFTLLLATSKASLHQFWGVAKHEYV
jgi:signal transduction histidine kinase